MFHFKLDTYLVRIVKQHDDLDRFLVNIITPEISTMFDNSEPNS